MELRVLPLLKRSKCWITIGFRIWLGWIWSWDSYIFPRSRRRTYRFNPPDKVIPCDSWRDWSKVVKCTTSAEFKETCGVGTVWWGSIHWPHWELQAALAAVLDLLFWYKGCRGCWHGESIQAMQILTLNLLYLFCFIAEYLPHGTITVLHYRDV